MTPAVWIKAVRVVSWMIPFGSSIKIMEYPPRLITGVDCTCNPKKEAIYAASITGREDVPANSEQTLLKVVANQPISVAIDASGSDFQLYSRCYCCWLWYR